MAAFGRDEEMGAALSDPPKRGQEVEAGVDQEWISLLESGDEFLNETVVGGGGTSEGEAEGSAANEVKQAGKLDGNGTESLLPAVSSEASPEGTSFG
jgi:hypothetical protein